MSASVGTTLKSPASTTGASSGVKLGGVRQEPFHPGELVFEFRSGLRIAVRRIERGDEHAIHRRFDVAALRVVWIAGQSVAGQDRLAAAREDRDAVPRFLPAPNRAVTCLFDCRDRKAGIRRLELLKAGNVRSRAAEPIEEIGEPLVDVVDVEGRDFHPRRC